jgi:uncharacterized protein YndB with AHSA1/START domain
MKLGEGPTVEAEVRIAAPPARVWPLLTDINLPARYSSEFRGAEWLDGAEVAAIGGRFRGHNHHPAGGDWDSVSTVVELEEGRVIAWAVENPDNPGAVWRFTLEPEEGGSVLRQWVRLGPGPSGLSMAISSMPDKEDRIIERRLDEHRRNMEATVAGIKALAEGGAEGRDQER